MTTTPGKARRGRKPYLREIIEQRLHATATTWKEIGDILGVHRGLLSRKEMHDMPIGTAIALARRLSLPITDLAPELAVLTSPPAPRRHGRADDQALTIAAALAHARTPLTTGHLAEALGWAEEDVDAAIDHLTLRPYLTGAHTLYQDGDGAYGLQPRHDLLTINQHTALRDARSALDALTPQEATALFAIMKHQSPHYAKPELDTYLDANADTLHELRLRGLIDNYGPVQQRPAYPILEKDVTRCVEHGLTEWPEPRTRTDTWRDRVPRDLRPVVPDDPDTVDLTDHDEL